MKKLLSKALSVLFTTLIIATTIIAIVLSGISPSNNRQWSPDQAVLVDVWAQDDSVSINHIRNIDYRTTQDYDIKYYDKTFQLDELETGWFVVEPFSGFGDAAHTMMSFGFKNGDFLTISIEIRKEKNETFSPWKGLFKQYEIMYVLADERDSIRLRTNYRHDKVFVYPVKADQKELRMLFLDMLQGAQKIKKQPEFYNTIFNNCTNLIARHVNRIAPGRIPWNKSFILTAKSDRYAYDIGLLNTELSFEDAQKAYSINDAAQKADQDVSFSKVIRQNFPEKPQ